MITSIKVDTSVYKIDRLLSGITCQITNGVTDHHYGILDFKQIVQRLCVKKLPQRVQISWPELSTMFEIMFVPLNDDWYETKMVGTNSQYIFIAVSGFGNYPVNFLHRGDWQMGELGGYLNEKLRINNLLAAIGIEALLFLLKEEYKKIEEFIHI